MLAQDRPPTASEIDESVGMVWMMQHSRGVTVDRDVLLKEIESKVAIWQDDSVGLVDNRDHVEWLAEARLERSWDFWERYRRYLEDVQVLPPRVVRRLDQSTDRILSRIEDPHRPGRWRRTGLVAGQVQSGKTGNYIGLVCKAADAGYKLIVVLAGIHNSLRSQTQLRVDEGLLGFDTQYQLRSDETTTNSSRIGVGIIPGAKRLKVASLTNSSEKGDFNRGVAKNMALPIGDYPVVLVVKKHKSVLEYIRKWMVEVEGHATAGSENKVVHDIPLLIIDDEADHASVDTSKDDDGETDPTAINAAIRRLLNSFDRAAYVGYTATPFANIYIDDDADHAALGADLFPESFIESLAAPSNYFGPERLFGLTGIGPDAEQVDPLPIYSPITDQATWMPQGHKKDWIPPEPLPPSLQKALNSFVLSCAARRARGQGQDHSSMLIHVTHYVDVQGRVREQVDDYIGLLGSRLRDTHGAQADEALRELEELWKEDFVPTSAHFSTDEAPVVAWKSVVAELAPALQKMVVRAINGSSRDALEYYDHRKTGLSVIAVGGNRLSRGLTLEGLSVSYYLRASAAYDTLLQMGRWFGYRRGYEDLCRLFTTRSLYHAYQEITAADDELRHDFEEMAALGETPTTFGLKVRASSAGLMVTAANKRRRGKTIKLSYSADIPETTSFSLDPEPVAMNFANLVQFVDRLGDNTGQQEGELDSVVWDNVSPHDVIEGFFDGYRPDGRSYRVRPTFIADYIRKCTADDELQSWTVRLVSNPGSPERQKIGAWETGLVQRAPLVRRAAGKREPVQKGEFIDHYMIRRVLSPPDESRDLTEDQKERALVGTRTAARERAERTGKLAKYKEPTVPTGRPLRKVRGVDQPLLLLYPLIHPEASRCPDRSPIVGFAVSFPESTRPRETEYIVNNIWRELEIDDLDDDE
ncbi:Z1 domain-containing protein [Winogradskya humida]|nr:Z1 domain-containing protein [Actinoplanes humidus]